MVLEVELCKVRDSRVLRVESIVRMGWARGSCYSVVVVVVSEEVSRWD